MASCYYTLSCIVVVAFTASVANEPTISDPAIGQVTWIRDESGKLTRSTVDVDGDGQVDIEARVECLNDQPAEQACRFHETWQDFDGNGVFDAHFVFEHGTLQGGEWYEPDNWLYLYTATHWQASLFRKYGVKLNYEGDGDLWDAGAFSYIPRYVITYPVLSLSAPRDHLFHFRGAPPVELSLHLEMLSDKREYVSEAEYEEMRRVLDTTNTTLEVAIHDSSNNVMCWAFGSLLGDWTASSERALMGPKARYRFWHAGCLDVRLDPLTDYRLSIKVHSLRGAERPIALRPYLEGGGLDSP